ncbi:MAG: hypothetical protein JXA20_15300 [Spirochaetes bacterium]|nr:hypothetical protein [Spirochaetota bacterium]
MTALKRCKACGLIINESKIKDLCPACGVPKITFEPYTERVSLNRKRLLDLHMHPIMVHIPQALISLLPLMVAGHILLPERYGIAFLHTATVLSALLPVSAAATVVSGMLDGRIRFKKITTPYLKQKMLIGGIMLLMTVGMAAIAVTSGFVGFYVPLYLGLNALCLLCQYLLGTIGVQLMFSVLPG